MTTDLLPVEPTPEELRAIIVDETTGEVLEDRALMPVSQVRTWLQMQADIIWRIK